MKFVKFVLLLAVLLVFLVAADQFASYWLGMGNFNFSDSAPLAFFHAVVLGGIGYAFFRLIKHKF